MLPKIQAKVLITFAEAVEILQISANTLKDMQERPEPLFQQFSVDGDIRYLKEEVEEYADEYYFEA